MYMFKVFKIEHGYWLELIKWQSPNNFHPLHGIFRIGYSGTNVLPRRDEGSGKPCAVIGYIASRLIRIRLIRIRLIRIRLFRSRLIRVRLIRIRLIRIRLIRIRLIRIHLIHIRLFRIRQNKNQLPRQLRKHHDILFIGGVLWRIFILR